MRSHYCGDINRSDIGSDIEISGWVHKRRDHGGVIFLDVRDIKGICQAVVNPDNEKSFKLAESIRNEYVVQIKGNVRNRLEGTINKNMHTGEIEIEVGHIFKLGRLYAESMKANVLNSEGKASTLYMGCYGIGVSRLVAAAIEQNFDEKGIIWPHSIAPFDINIISIGFEKDEKISSASINLYEELKSMGYDVLLDDRKDGYGAKMKDSELIGIPLNIIIGNSYLKNQEVELKGRNGQSSSNPISDIKTILDFFKNK